MSSDRQSDRRQHDGFAEFAEELRLLAEVLLARVEPVLRRTAADGAADLGGCAWCPVCAAAALVRGDHHDVVAALAEHGTSMVTVLREALAGVPVEPVLPPEWADHAAGHPGANRSAAARHPTAESQATTGRRGAHGAQPDARSANDPTTHDDRSANDRTARGDRPDARSVSGMGGAAGAQPDGRFATFRDHPDSRQPTRAKTTHGNRPTGGSGPHDDPRRASGRGEQPTPRPRRVDEFTARTPHISPDADESPSDTGLFATEQDPEANARPAADKERSANTRAPRSRYVDIPVTIRG
ncbi:hypothetical protein [Nocardia caishijiensis]|uniref:DUF222 domain-containing protein n=1 Tax=Nocardia caishijiensis TaxID=184756 RepID=A0ABQ6YFV3_9NOCA|nr:hypothetical protein [Nocardia caishijiensis]KAF0842506.1 hypothetical protein FNL39_11187 [Nocardia caishijiensis]